MRINLYWPQRPLWHCASSCARSGGTERNGLRIIVVVVVSRVIVGGGGGAAAARGLGSRLITLGGATHTGTHRHTHTHTLEHQNV